MSVRISLELEEHQAMALAQLAKRFGWHHANELSSKWTVYDEAPECDVMIDAVCRLGRALAEEGFAPR